jgi:hypothetical protein
MPNELPNLAGVVTQDLVETIGAGSFKASYLNWSRSLNLLRSEAPGWNVELVPTSEGAILHRAPVGGYLLIRFRHLDGTVTPEVPQAVMDHRNAAIPFEKITARDITDTHRRGACLAAAMTFGLAYELWAKMPLESGYNIPEGQQTPPTGRPSVSQTPPPDRPAATKESFLEAALAKGLSTHAAEALLAKIGANYAGGISTLAAKTDEWVADQNAAHGPQAEDPKSKPARSRAKSTAVKESAESY